MWWCNTSYINWINTGYISPFAIGYTLVCGWRFEAADKITAHVVGNISRRFSSNSEANVLELLEIIEEMFPCNS